jgi:hypothetical protein
MSHRILIMIYFIIFIDGFKACLIRPPPPQEQSIYSQVRADAERIALQLTPHEAILRDLKERFAEKLSAEAFEALSGIVLDAMRRSFVGGAERGALFMSLSLQDQARQELQILG